MADYREQADYLERYEATQRGETPTPAPYFADEHVQLFHGDFRDLLPAVLAGVEPDLVIADPPYGETALDWDRWPDGWPSQVPGRSMWCFGSMRMFLDRGAEFPAAGWKLAQDVVWEKQQSATFKDDRFARVHEFATHWYRGPWGQLHRDTPTEFAFGRRAAFHSDFVGEPAVHGKRGKRSDYADKGTRAMRSVIRVNNLRNGNQSGINPTEKPTGLLEPLIVYGCPVGGLVVDVFAGSCSALVAARATGRRAIGFELRESQCESAARRLSQGDLFAGSAS